MDAGLRARMLVSPVGTRHGTDVLFLGCELSSLQPPLSLLGRKGGGSCQLEAEVLPVWVLREPHGWDFLSEPWLQPKHSGVSDLSQFLEKMLLLCAT